MPPALFIVKILHVIDTLTSIAGGPPIVAAALAVAHGRLGHDVTLAYYDLPPHETRVGENEVPGLSSIRHLRLPLRSSGDVVERFTARGARGRIENAVADADIVHLHNTWEPIALQASLLARRHSNPYLIAPHGMLHHWALSQRRIKKKLALLAGRRKMLEEAAALHVLNAQERREVAELNLPTPTRCIPNGVWPDTIDALPPAGRFRAKLPKAAQIAPLVLYLSRLHVKKGVDLLADIFHAASLPEAHLAVVGPDGGMRETLERRVRELDLSNRVHVVGPLYGAEKFEALQDADVFLFPSRQEGFPVAVLEAMGCGLPVIITDGTNVPEAGEAGAGRVLPLDVDKLAVALREVLRDESLRRTMAENGRRLVRERFTWPKVAERSIEVYSEFVKSPAKVA